MGGYNNARLMTKSLHVVCVNSYLMAVTVRCREGHCRFLLWVGAHSMKRRGRREGVGLEGRVAAVMVVAV